MIRKVRQLWADWQQERQRQRELAEQLETLIDPMFLVRATRNVRGK